MNEESIRQIRDALKSERLTINALDDGSGVLLDIEDEQLLTLNATGMRLVRAIDEGAESIEALGQALTSEFEVDPDRARADSSAFLREVAAALF